MTETREGRFSVSPINGQNAYDNPLTVGRSAKDMDGLPSIEVQRRQSLTPRRESILSGWGMRRFSRDFNLQAHRTSVASEMIYDDGTYVPQMTQDIGPSIENYRDIFSISKHMARPTFDELHRQAQSRLERRNDTESGEKQEDMAIKFGWIRGVYMRCLLNIWGVMLFLRMGWMTGQAGIGLSIVIVLLASVVTVLTTMSMSAICTNGEVRGGGAYYMISRSLGPECGGAIGIILSFGNAVAVSMYIVGAAETVRDLLRTFENGIVEIPSDTNDVRISGICFLVLMTAITGVGMAFENKAVIIVLFQVLTAYWKIWPECNWTGACNTSIYCNRWMLRTTVVVDEAQIVLMVLLLMALMDYFVGACLDPTPEQMAKGYMNWNTQVARDNLGPDFRGESFFSVFSVFFPSVTGILAGANISGDLKDPCVSIPKGTFLAIVTTSFSYVIIIIWLGFTMLRDATGNVEDLADGSFANCTGRPCAHGLLNYNQVMEMSSGFGPLIYVGIFAATLSSALAALISAPRIFQALCKDKVIPVLYFFAKGYGPSNDPRRASVLVFIIALLCIIIAELNVIAPIISNFFMASYCLINYSCFHASYVKSPGWRPEFRYYNKWMSLVGAVLCVSVMFIMNWITALFTLGVVLCLYIYMNKNKIEINWGSSTQGYSYKNALTAVTKLNKIEEHVKTYRPAILVLTGNASSRPPLVDFADLLTKNTGLLVCGHVIKGPLPLSLRTTMIEHNSSWLENRRVKAFYSLVESDTFTGGVQSLIQLVGLGKLRPNILMMGFKKRWNENEKEELLEYFNVIHSAIDMNLAFCILRLEEGLDYTSYFESDLGIPFLDSSDDNADDPPVPPDVDGDSIGPAANMGRMGQSYPMSIISEEHRDSGEETHPENDSVEGDSEPEMQTSLKLQRFRRLMSMGATRLHPRAIPSEVSAAVNQFQDRQKPGTIDVWWLYDDGGLTLLLPYVLTEVSQWSHCKLRVFSITHGDGDLDSAQVNMAALIKKFRIDYAAVTVLTDARIPPQENTVKHFKSLIRKWMTNKDSSNNPLDITKTDLKMHKEKTNRHLRLRELLLKYSKDSNIIFMTIPLPRKDACPASLYMAWLEMMTKDLPPVLMVRGNQSSVLTFYS